MDDRAEEDHQQSQGQLLSSPPLQDTPDFDVDLTRMVPNGGVDLTRMLSGGGVERPEASSPMYTPEPQTPPDMLDAHSPDMHAPPSTPKLSHPVQPDEYQCLISPGLSNGIGEGRVPLWIKRRGKWQAGLQCSLEDCPVQTIKAMPTYGRKSYIVVFFPISKTFAWTDWQLVCPILEIPEPLAFGTHESGRHSVSDLDGARKFTFEKIISALLDISDRLPLQAVVECARDVQFWRDFAKNAARAVTYQELGGFLVTLKNMIIPTFIKAFWLQNHVEDWTRQCEIADSAALMEKLANELRSAVDWDEIAKLWDQSEQTNLDSEWANWKKNAQNDSFARPCDPKRCISEGNYHECLPTCGVVEDYETQNSKRLKIEGNSSLCESVAGNFMQQGICKNTYVLSLSVSNSSTVNRVSTPNGGAFTESGGYLDRSEKGKVLMPDSPGDQLSGAICIGTTKYGRRCTHKAREGSVFCLKHTSKPGSGCENFVSIPLKVASSDRRVLLQPPMAEQVIHESHKRNHVTASTAKFNLTSSKSSKPASKVPAQVANHTQCSGWCTNGIQCSHRAKVGFIYCEKHLPSSMKGQERSCASTASDDNTLSWIRVKELVNEYTRLHLGKDGSQSSHHSDGWPKVLDAILSEVGSNLNLTESLCKLIFLEMESLKNHFEQEVDDCQKASSSTILIPIEHGDCLAGAGREVAAFEHLSNVELLKQVSLNSTVSIPRYRCKLCAQEFVEVSILGQHWRACHKKEAQQYFRGFLCQHCNLPLNNKKALYRHRNSQHPGMSSQPKSSPLALCNICKGQFMGFEDLWQHVICSHPDHMCVYWPAAPDTNSPPAHWKPLAVEVCDYGKCVDCNYTFSNYSALQQHRESVHKSRESNLHMQSFQRNCATQGELKYKCKICGLRFRLLPDLGRHHQAEHKPPPALQLKKKENIKKEIPSSSPLGELNSPFGEGKKKLQKLDIRRAPVVNHTAEAAITTQQTMPCGQRISDIEGYVGPKIEGIPSNDDIFAVARSACCTNKLYSVLLKKYFSLPDDLALKAAKLCNEANIKLEFFHQGYVCPYSCKEVALEFPESKQSIDTSLSLRNGLLSPSWQFSSSQLLPEKPCLPKNEDHVLDESHSQLTCSLDVKTTVNNKIVLCEDLSFGKESVPIPCVIDRVVLGPCSCSICLDNPNREPESVMPWSNFQYVTKRTLDPSLGIDTESSGLGCGCQGSQCSPAQCEHVYIFDIDNTDAQDIFGQPMVGRFPYDRNGCIILEEGYLVYECNSLCSCHESCNNRVLQKGVQLKLEVYKTKHKGWAVRAAQSIARGTFVCEYIGEVLDDCEANKRGERYDKEGCSYLYDIDAHIDIRRRGRPKPFVIDATKFGNVARFINHSCFPNLVNYQVLVESMDCQLAHIGLYATRDINIGEELAYDYRYKLLPGKGCPCQCGAKECRGRLY